MASVSSDGSTLVDFGGFNVCTGCSEATHGSEGNMGHRAGCSISSPQAPPTPRTSDANTYVMTSKGLERASVVEKRREAERGNR